MANGAYSNLVNRVDVATAWPPPTFTLPSRRPAVATK